VNTSVQTMPLGGNLLTETSTAMAIYTVHSLAALFIIAFLLLQVSTRVQRASGLLKCQ
jgi:hypothetical protein